MEIVTIITARGNSKAIPGKNLVLLAGKPLIAWSIEAALACPRITKTIVSTDSLPIAEVARRHGAEVPFLRPAALGGDDVPHFDVVVHALDWLRHEESFDPDYLLLLQPTSPLRTTGDIRNSIHTLEERLRRNAACPAVVSVCSAHDHPYLTKRISPAGSLEDFVEPDLYYLRRQDLPPAYVLNGAIYLVRCDVLRAEHNFCPRGAIPYVMPRERSLDIDTPEDLLSAQQYMSSRQAA